ncbi:hypothetical protein G9A89_004683 [Geosiphon pyriformis]|nr:hypothetical protein G9A89_004683 [Geosiphon pyriformis]
MQLQTPNSSLICFSRPEDFISLRSPTQQPELIFTSANLLDYLAKNQSNHSENLGDKENISEFTEEETNKNENEEITTAYIAKISEFTGEDADTSPQEWLDKVSKVGDANG